MIETERLVLRYFCRADALALERIFGDAEVMRFGDGVQSAEWIDEWLRGCLEKYQQGEGIWPWAVTRKGQSEAIGYCGLFFFPDVCGQPETELGYRLARAWWGQGYATEAAEAVCDYAFSDLRLTRLIAMIDPGNMASIRVAQKLGMSYEKEVMLPGYTHPDHIYAITNDLPYVAPQ